MQQTKYCTDVIMMSVSGRKVNEHITTHETDATRHEASPGTEQQIVKPITFP